MLIIDANIVLRLMLNDNDDMVNQAHTRLLTDTPFENPNLQRPRRGPVLGVQAGLFPPVRANIKKSGENCYLNVNIS